MSAENCYNIGIISGNSRVGSIIGQASGANCNNCYYTSVNPTTGNSGTVSNCLKLTTNELFEYASILNSQCFSKDYNNINSGYPILNWNK